MPITTINLGFQGVCRIFPLDSHMDREFFKCGNHYLDRMLRNHDCDNSTNLKIYAALLDNHVIGFYAISAQSRFLRAKLPNSEKVMRVNSAVILLHGIAVRNDFQKKFIGKTLLNHCIETTLHISTLLGVEALCLEAIDEELVKYYQGRNFILNTAYSKSDDHGIEMFVAISTLRQLPMGRA